MKKGPKRSLSTEESFDPQIWYSWQCWAIPVQAGRMEIKTLSLKKGRLKANRNTLSTITYPQRTVPSRWVWIRSRLALIQSQILCWNVCDWREFQSLDLVIMDWFHSQKPSRSNTLHVGGKKFQIFNIF